jgi:hypothetical protein
MDDIYQNIPIFREDFARLQAIATPLVDTTAEVVRRLLDAYENSLSEREESPNLARESHHYLVGVHPVPSLRHAKLMASQFNGKQPVLRNWNSLVRQALIQTYKAVGKNVSELRLASGANIVEGKKADEGYRLVSAHDFSFQGASSDDALKIIMRCARELGVGFKAEFVWREKPEAAFPGKKGCIEFIP